MKTTEEIHAELLQFAIDRLKLPAEVFLNDPTFEEMNIDSLTKLEILLYGDDTFGSHVLDYLEDGLLKDYLPNRLSELALLIPKCMRPAKDVYLERKAATTTSVDILSVSGEKNEF